MPQPNGDSGKTGTTYCELPQAPAGACAMNRYGPRVLSASLSLTSEASNVPVARRFVQSQLDAWGYEEAAWVAAQITSELAGNCALHARTEYTVTISVDGGEARLEVRDGSPAVPRQRGYGPTATTGRGLDLVGHLSTDWGVERVPPGKAIWVVFALSPDAGGEHDDADSDRVTHLFLHADEADTTGSVTDQLAA